MSLETLTLNREVKLLKVPDDKGRPISGVSVSYKQITRDFLFGVSAGAKYMSKTPLTGLRASFISMKQTRQYFGKTEA